jgi:hypothetical protein
MDDRTEHTGAGMHDPRRDVHAGQSTPDPWACDAPSHHGKSALRVARRRLRNVEILVRRGREYSDVGARAEAILAREVDQRHYPVSLTPE